MAFGKPVFRQTGKDIEESLEQKLVERTKAIEERTKVDVQAVANATSQVVLKQLEERITKV